ncbi:MAG TPA: hypothetical protein VIK25_01645 [Gemmatimonadaceae bacterium]
MDRGRAPKYAHVAESFLESAGALATLADADEGYGNAIALLATHAVIAWADAVSIRYAEQKATDGDHEQAAAVLRDSVRNLLTTAAEKALRGVLAEKDAIAYQGRYYPLAQGINVLEQARKFAKWAREVYEKGA